MYLMKSRFSQFVDRWDIIRLIELVALVAAIVGYSEFRIYQTNAVIQDTRSQLASTTVQLQSINEILSQVANQNATLNDAIQGEVTKSDAFAEQLGKVNDTVGTLDELSKLDPQLLQKYSKVYFLNENYKPAQLATIPQDDVYDKTRLYQFLFQAWPFLDKLMKAAAADGQPLEIISAYRSFSTQSALKNEYKVTYGAGTANSFSADQGYSEHQLGTALDFTTAKTGDNFNSFDATGQYTWLTNNAYKYGFVLSYPKGNKYYVYEPWHWRFVGVDLATRIHAEGKHFYDLDQRDIDDYLLLIFK